MKLEQSEYLKCKSCSKTIGEKKERIEQRENEAAGEASPVARVRAGEASSLARVEVRDARIMARLKRAAGLASHSLRRGEACVLPREARSVVSMFRILKAYFVSLLDLDLGYAI